MTLTIYDLDNIKKQCDNLSKTIKEIKDIYNPTSLDRKLFVSREDYYESLKQRKENPQDYYFFRHFDKFIQIVFDKKQKKYIIFCEEYYNPEILTKYQRVQRSKKSFIISKDFEETLNVYQNIINDIINSNKLQNGLF